MSVHKDQVIKPLLALTWFVKLFNEGPWLHLFFHTRILWQLSFLICNFVLEQLSKHIVMQMQFLNISRAFTSLELPLDIFNFDCWDAFLELNRKLWDSFFVLISSGDQHIQQHDFNLHAGVVWPNKLFDYRVCGLDCGALVFWLGLVNESQVNCLRFVVDLVEYLGFLRVFIADWAH